MSEVKYDEVQGNVARRLPIVFCLDVSPSMGWREGNNSSSIELLNAAVNGFLSELQNDARVCAAVEVSFVTFSTDVIEDTGFENIRFITPRKYTAVEHGGTFISKAVLRSIEKIEEKKRELEDSEIQYFAPFLILVTDGDPDAIDISNSSTYNEALNAVKSHCDSHVGATEIIIPFIIGVGDHMEVKTLTRYAEGFTNGYFSVRGNASSIKTKFSKVFELIGNSTKKSVHLNAGVREIIKSIQCDANVLLKDLIGRA